MIQELETMRKELIKKGAFDQPYNSTNTKKKRIELTVKQISNVLKENEALKIWGYFKKDELCDLIERKFPKISKGLNIREILVEMSREGWIPELPDRLFNCQRCGKEQKKPLTKWQENEKNYCDDCQKDIDILNKPKTEQCKLDEMRKKLKDKGAFDKEIVNDKVKNKILAGEVHDSVWLSNTRIDETDTDILEVIKNLKKVTPDDIAQVLRIKHKEILERLKKLVGLNLIKLLEKNYGGGIYSPTKSGYKSWQHKNTGSYEEFLLSCNVFVRVKDETS